MANLDTPNKRRTGGALWWDQTYPVPSAGLDAADRASAGWQYSGILFLFWVEVGTGDSHLWTEVASADSHLWTEITSGDAHIWTEVATP